MLVSRSMNEDVCPRKVLPYILMGLSPATFCSFSWRVINNNPCLLLPAALGWLCSHPALTHTHTFISWDSAARRGWGSSGIFHSCGKGVGHGEAPEPQALLTSSSRALRVRGFPDFGFNLGSFRLFWIGGSGCSRGGQKSSPGAS